jgi:hypothetical protein
MKQKVKFIKMGSSQAFGGFEPGQTATLDVEVAAHLCDEAQCAERVGEPFEGRMAAKQAKDPQHEANIKLAVVTQGNAAANVGKKKK